MAHQLAFHGIAASHADAAHHLIIGQHGAQLGAPVDGDISQVSQPIVHQHLLLPLLVPGVPLRSGEVQLFGLRYVEPLSALLGEYHHQLADGACLLRLVAVVTIKELNESPLRPVVISRFAGAHLAIPIEAETYLVQLFAIAGNILLGGYSGVLPRLNGILLGGQPIGIIAHRVQHVVAPQTLIAGIDIAGNIAQRMPHMQPRTRWVRKHVQYVIVWPLALVQYMVRAMLAPVVLPPRFKLSEVIVHFLSIVYRSRSL